MPNPKTGTVTMDVAKAVQEAKAGKLEYRTDRGANVHLTLGKRSFDEKQLAENYAALIDEIMRAKPAAAKGRYINGVTLTTTMGPGIHVDPRGRGASLKSRGAPAEELYPRKNYPSPKTVGRARAQKSTAGGPSEKPALSGPPLAGPKCFEEVIRC